MPNEFGNLLIRLRAEREMSQADLARKLEISKREVSRLESGEAIPRTQILIQVSEAFNIDLEDLLEINLPSKSLKWKMIVFYVIPIILLITALYFSYIGESMRFAEWYFIISVGGIIALTVCLQVIRIIKAYRIESIANSYYIKTRSSFGTGFITTMSFAIIVILGIATIFLCIQEDPIAEKALFIIFACAFTVHILKREKEQYSMVFLMRGVLTSKDNYYYTPYGKCRIISAKKFYLGSMLKGYDDELVFKLHIDIDGEKHTVLLSKAHMVFSRMNYNYEERAHKKYSQKSIGGSAFLANILFFFAIVWVLLLFITNSSLLYRNDYRNVLDKELKPLSTISSIAADENIVCVFYDSIHGANVYDNEGHFLYSVLVPKSQNGLGGIDVIEGQVMIYNNFNNCFVYQDGVFISKSKSEDINPDYQEIYVQDIKYINSLIGVTVETKTEGYWLIRRSRVLLLFYPTITFIIILSSMLIGTFFTYRYKVKNDNSKCNNNKE